MSTQAAAVNKARGLRAWLLQDVPDSITQARAQRFYLAWLTFRRNPIAMTGFLIIAALVLLAIFAPLVTSTNGLEPQLQDRLQPASAAHWFGTDGLGRDIYDRIVWGSRITLYIVGLVGVIVVPVGLVVGTLAGYVGGAVDNVLMRITDIFLAFPRLILALALVAALGPGLENAVLAIALTTWSPYARIARAEALTIRNSEFIMAAKVQGASTGGILFRHVMPLCISSVIVRLTLDMAGIILTAAGLGFLGLGAQPPTPEWGAMISTGRQYLLDQWWIPTVPGIAIFVVSLGFNLLGDGLRDVLDPKSAE
ncbi:MAG: ABC transporter permease subunit [Gammaproteobacteria bacterium]|jgi:peptide/nickel transport system permease protein|nr:ABC transporter permease subunit [Gammaproteobacteria bacterium]